MSMIQILANDGISKAGENLLIEKGFKVCTTPVKQEDLIDYINSENIAVLLVRSATTVRKNLIDSCPSLKIIGRGGVGMDNIDVEYAKEKGINVINTPASSTNSVAELVFAHLYGGARFLYDANRNMPLTGDSNFKGLKKNYSNGQELKGKTMGIIGFGRIGQQVARIALGIGMEIFIYDKFIHDITISISLFNGQSIDVDIKTQPFEKVLEKSDFITLHIPSQKGYVISENELNKMKKGAAIINTSRGGLIDEEALIKALDNNKISFAALDTFENEPTPDMKVLMHPKISLSPHIGASTNEAQENIGLELADKIINHFN